MDNSSPDEEACYENPPDWITDPYFQSEASFEQQKKQSEEMSGRFTIHRRPFCLTRCV